MLGLIQKDEEQLKELRSEVAHLEEMNARITKVNVDCEPPLRMHNCLSRERRLFYYRIF